MEVGILADTGQEKDLTSDLRYPSICVACPGFHQGSVEEAGLRLGEAHAWAVPEKRQSSVGWVQAG